jgi:hypothetical protein
LKFGSFISLQMMIRGGLRNVKMMSLSVRGLTASVNNLVNNENYQTLGNSARNILSQQGFILETISDEDYVKHHPFYLGSSVGGHVRHVLDHWSKLMNHDYAISSTEAKGDAIDYDSRERNTEIETNRLVALKINERILHQLNSALLHRTPDTPLQVMFLGDSQSGVRYTVDSTFGRELSFVAHHATHHLSTIKLLMQTMSYESLPTTIGMAHSTIQYWNKDSKT